MAFKIVVPSIDDASIVANTHLRAMDSNELLLAKFPDAECWSFLREWLRKDTIEHITDGKDKCILVARDTKTGQITSFVKWLIQRPKESPDDPDAEEEQWPATCRTQYLDTYTTLTKEARKELMGDQPYYRESLT